MRINIEREKVWAILLLNYYVDPYLKSKKSKKLRLIENSPELNHFLLWFLWHVRVKTVVMEQREKLYQQGWNFKVKWMRPLGRRTFQFIPTRTITAESEMLSEWHLVTLQRVPLASTWNMQMSTVFECPGVICRCGGVARGWRGPQEQG